MGADVHNDHPVAGDEAVAIGSGGEGLVAELEGDFGEEAGLVALLDGGGVAAGVDDGGEDEAAPR